MPIADIGQLVAKQFQSAPETNWLGSEVEAYAAAMIQASSIIWPQLSTPVVAIRNVGILFEPDLAINPAIWLKRMTKELTIILLWAGQFQPPGLFYWNTTNQCTLNLSDAAPQRIAVAE